jgi:alpha-1,6-mannosyltransferase
MPSYSKRLNSENNGWPSIAFDWVLYTLLALMLFLLTGTDRTDHYPLFVLYTVSFGLYLLLYGRLNSKGMSLKDWVAWGIIICLLLSKPPIWSDDVFRFMWDGRLSLEGFNPYQFTPTSWIELHPASPDMTQLYARLNSQEYFSVYPPLKQLFFHLSAWLSPKSVAGQIYILKGILLIGLIFTAGVGHFFIRDTGREPKVLFLLLFNPLLLTESLVNLHFEGWQLGFLLLSVWLLLRNKSLIGSALAFSMACLVKLLPLLFLPFIMKYLGLKKGLYFSAISILITILAFLPWVNLSLLYHILDSINLYFQHFEFNASVYYIIRTLGFMWKGYNIISMAGPFLAIIMLVIAIVLSYLQRTGSEMQLLKSMFYGLAAYFLLATTVHPWYIITMLGLGVWIFPKTVAFWTFLTFFSYHAYCSAGVQENVIWSIASYGIIIVMHLYMYRKSTNQVLNL